VGRLTLAFDPAGFVARFTRLVLVVRRLIIST
jgi:hypothetical protein